MAKAKSSTMRKASTRTKAPTQVETERKLITACLEFGASTAAAAGALHCDPDPDAKNSAKISDACFKQAEAALSVAQELQATSWAALNAKARTAINLSAQWAGGIEPVRMAAFFMSFAEDVKRVTGEKVSEEWHAASKGGAA